MNGLDLAVFALYGLGLLAMSSVFVRRMKDSKDMFAAGGQSPWWVSGLSAFMTLFSAGTFVVWGGISFRYGVVGASILGAAGVGALLVGRFLASYWKGLGVESATEFLDLRFGNSLVQFYTWLQGTVGIFGMGGAVYALAVIISALVPLPVDHFLANPETGHLSVTLTSLAICLVVILITFGGGLWAVLMTDVLQFIILTVSVLAVVPMLFVHVGGVGAFVEATPDGFFFPAAAEYSLLFLAGWMIIHFFKVGGDWAFVQRHLCVPTGKDARKSAYLFGGLLLVCPIFWMLPPMIFRTIQPEANPEQAYILACQLVLPAGMMGLMIAAMCSATASTATTQLNVYAGALTSEVYKRFWRPHATERELVMAGRIITILLGLVVLAGAILIPLLGSYTGWVLASTAILSGPLLLPTVWGLFSRKIGLGSAWAVTGLGVGAGVLAKFGLAADGPLDGLPVLGLVNEWANLNPHVTEIVIGLAVPIGILLALELTLKKTNRGWEALMAVRTRRTEERPLQPSTLPARLCGSSVGMIGLLMAVLALMGSDQRLTLVIFSGVLLAISAAIFAVAREKKPTPAANAPTPAPEPVAVERE